jgi:hypothetical protein
MTEAAVLFVRPGAVRASDKGALRKVGVVVVEVADPHDVRFVRAEGFNGAHELPHGDLLVAAAKAIQADDSYGHVKQAFADALAAALIARHGSPA